MSCKSQILPFLLISVWRISLLAGITVRCNCRGGYFFSTSGSVSCPEEQNGCNSYAENQHVMWGMLGSGVNAIKFTKFSTEEGFDNVSIISQLQTNAYMDEVFRLTGSNGDILKSEFLVEGTAAILFKTDNSVERAGFRFTYGVSSLYRSVPAPMELIRSKSGVRVSHPDFGVRNYPGNFKVAWSIYVPPNHSVTLWLERFDTELRGDVLNIYSGLYPNLGTQLRELSGKRAAETLHFRHSVTLKFSTDGKIERTGFKFGFTVSKN